MALRFEVLTFKRFGRTALKSLWVFTCPGRLSILSILSYPCVYLLVCIFSICLYLYVSVCLALLVCLLVSHSLSLCLSVSPLSFFYLYLSLSAFVCYLFYIISLLVVFSPFLGGSISIYIFSFIYLCLSVFDYLCLYHLSMSLLAFLFARALTNYLRLLFVGLADFAIDGIDGCPRTFRM